MMAEWLILCLQAPASVWVPVCVPAAPLPVRLPACGLGAVESGPKSWDPGLMC